jgi:hypothetical protein
LPPFAYVVIDGSGPLKLASKEGNVYIWAIMCKSTRWCELFFTNQKDQTTVYNIFLLFVNIVSIFRCKIHHVSVTLTLESDLGGEFVNASMHGFCVRNGIEHIKAARNMHVKIIERYFQTMWNSCSKSMFSADAPHNLWEHAASHHCFLRNRIGYRTIDDMESPYFMLYGKHPEDLRFCKMFYTVCWKSIDSFKPKFDVEENALGWLGLSSQTTGGMKGSITGHKVIHKKTGRIFVEGMLTFHENPTSAGKLIIDRRVNSFDIQNSETYRRLIFEVPISKEKCIKSLVKICKHRVIFSEDDEQCYTLVLIQTETQAEPFWTYVEVLIGSNPEWFDTLCEYIVAFDYGNDFPLFKIVNVKKTKRLFEGIIIGFHDLDAKRYQIVARDGSSDFYRPKDIESFQHHQLLILNNLSLSQVSSEFLNYINPKNRTDAKKRNDWKEWEKAEKIEDNRAEEFRYFIEWAKDKPKNVFIHTMKLVYQLQLLSDGTLWKYKVRYIVRGFSFIFNRDYFATYAPVTQITSIKLFLMCVCITIYHILLLMLKLLI